MWASGPFMTDGDSPFCFVFLSLKTHTHVTSIGCLWFCKHPHLSHNSPLSHIPALFPKCHLFPSVCQASTPPPSSTTRLLFLQHLWTQMSFSVSPEHHVFSPSEHPLLGEVCFRIAISPQTVGCLKAQSRHWTHTCWEIEVNVVTQLHWPSSVVQG